MHRWPRLHGLCLLVGLCSSGPATAQWAERTPLPLALRAVETFAVGGHLIVLGSPADGRGDARVFVASSSPAAAGDTWHEQSSYGPARIGYAAFEHAGRICVLGGLVWTTTGLSPTDSVRCAQFTDGTLSEWSDERSLPAASDGLSATVTRDDTVVVAGPVGTVPTHTTVWAAHLLPEEILEWQELEPLVEGRTWRTHFRLVAAGDTAYAFGGHVRFGTEGVNTTASVRSSQVVGGFTAGWRDAADLPHRRAQFGVARLPSGAVALVGGYYWELDATVPVLDVDVIDVNSSGNLEDVPPLPDARAEAGVAFVDGALYVVGGIEPEHRRVLASVLQFQGAGAVAPPSSTPATPQPTLPRVAPPPPRMNTPNGRCGTGAVAMLASPILLRARRKRAVRAY